MDLVCDVQLLIAHLPATMGYGVSYHGRGCLLCAVSRVYRQTTKISPAPTLFPPSVMRADTDVHVTYLYASVNKGHRQRGARHLARIKKFIFAHTYTITSSILKVNALNTPGTSPGRSRRFVFMGPGIGRDLLDSLLDRMAARHSPVPVRHRLVIWVMEKLVNRPQRLPSYVTIVYNKTLSNRAYLYSTTRAFKDTRDTPIYFMDFIKVFGTSVGTCGDTHFRIY